MSDLVTISQQALRTELSMMIREELAMTSASSQRLNNSLMSVENLQHSMKVAELFSKSNLVPKNYIGKPEDILVAMEMGFQLGLPYMQALQDIAVINGKPSLYGDGFMAVILKHPHCEGVKEEPMFDEKSGKIIGYTCTVNRKGHAPHSRTFTIEDARKANLLGKAGPWTQYESRMLQMRARGFAGRDKFADALRGIYIAEEAMDFIEGELAEQTQTSQTEQLKQKLKGLSYAESKVDPKPVSASPLPASNDVVEAVAQPLSSEANGVVDESSVGEVREQNPDANEKKARADGITETQLADIHMLIADKSIAKERVDAAIKKLGASTFETLSKKDADRILVWLEKA